jgi:hypothetical protein
MKIKLAVWVAILGLTVIVFLCLICPPAHPHKGHPHKFEAVNNAAKPFPPFSR